ncbi:MAG: hypothetical protein H6722_25210 [Sandaracinus sp.]|nr:hypothetical protein [Sandaracinus sp.]MCB9624005.1 hypothetical protein [Sandaracinus sp.]
MTRRASTLAGLGLATLMACSDSSPPPPPPPVALPSAPVVAPNTAPRAVAPVPATGNTALRALEAHLDRGETYAEGPDAESIAAAARHGLAPGDGVAVKVIPGTPRHVTVLVRYRSTGGYENLREIDQAERNEELDRILGWIDDEYQAGEDVIGVAIRGSMAYGAIAVRRPRSAVVYQTGRVLSSAPLEALLTAPAGEELPRVVTVGGPPIVGRLRPHPHPLPAHVLTLTESRAVRVQMRTTAPLDAMPVALVCRGAMRALACDDEDLVEPIDDLSDRILDRQAEEGAAAEARGVLFVEEIYTLAPDTYTLAVFGSECPDGQDACPATLAPYELRIL